MKVIEGGVTAAQGFLAAGLSAGIKKGNTKDMAMLYSKVPCEAAGTFTTNIVKAAPVKGGFRGREELEIAGAMYIAEVPQDIVSICHEINRMLTRINGVAFHNQEELEAWEKEQQEARERDHRRC